VKRLSTKGQITPITQECGTIFRKDTIETHILLPYNQASVKAMKLSSLSHAETVNESPMMTAICKSNAKLADKIGRFMLHIYGDAKKLTLSARTFPARITISHLASQFSYLDPKPQCEADLDFQYISPAAHKEFLQCIVESDRKSFAQKIMDVTLALSLRCDGSVDRTHTDKVYVMVKVIMKSGEENLYFLGAREPPIRGAIGHLHAVENACIETVGICATKHIFTNASSLVTDGTSINTGDKSGLWTLFRSKRRNVCEDNEIPLINI